jgi:hypothetical protein
MNFIAAYLLLTFEKAGFTSDQAELNALSSFLGLLERLNIESFYVERMPGLRSALGTLDIFL